ncbi:MAG: tRNA guanosine(34) transglycosylase Tgt [Candidatus Peregrinibacteria bacterium]|nr:tRNA guanosine(34) transglycosylase Tgt [Candidatus Peregrinibacteria bacterium]
MSVGSVLDKQLVTHIGLLCNPNARYPGWVFELLASTPPGRRGRLTTTHGVVESPFFMPVGTGGAMRGITHEDLRALGAQILLCNTYHLHLQPGEAIVEEAGGLHDFIGWQHPILTDSGGFQVFSLRRISDISDAGVHFRSHITGDPLFIGPEEAMRIQHSLGADVIMCFDHCPPSTAKRSEIIEAVDRTLRWAADCKRFHEELKTQRIQRAQKTQKLHASSESFASSESSPLLFGIVQGGLERDLREKCAQELIALGFDGYALGGLAVGETPEEMTAVLEGIIPLLPKDKARYLMGVGKRDQLTDCVKLGIDMFDCVLPMREARHGAIQLSDGSTIRIERSEFRHDHTPIDSDSPSPLSREHTKSYLHYLFHIHERLAETIACMQNLGVTLQTLRRLREVMDIHLP